MFARWVSVYVWDCNWIQKIRRQKIREAKSQLIAEDCSEIEVTKDMIPLMFIKRLKNYQHEFC